MHIRGIITMKLHSVSKRFFYWIYLSLYSNYSISGEIPKEFTYLHKVDPSIYQSMSFSTNDNFVGCPLDGYEGAQIICTRKLASVLKQVQITLKKKYPFYSLQVLDAYRPVRAVAHIQRWAKDLKDQKTKLKYYPFIDKKELLGVFIASKKSSHSRGSTVDIVIIDERSRERLDYGPSYFGEYTHFDYKKLTRQQRSNRYMLRKLMKEHGFKPYDLEYWHFTLQNEPFLKIYFDFPIRNSTK